MVYDADEFQIVPYMSYAILISMLQSALLRLRYAELAAVMNQVPIPFGK